MQNGQMQATPQPKSRSSRDAGKWGTTDIPGTELFQLSRRRMGGNLKEMESGSRVLYMKVRENSQE